MLFLLLSGSETGFPATRTQNAQTADVRGPEPRPAVELPILPDIALDEPLLHYRLIGVIRRFGDASAIGKRPRGSQALIMSDHSGRSVGSSRTHHRPRHFSAGRGGSPHPRYRPKGRVKSVFSVGLVFRC
jgi:hypothetical protein